MIPIEILEKYNMTSLENYETRHEAGKDTTITFYETFLSQTDYEVVRSAETGKPLPDNLSEYRQFARDEITRLRKE